jgi:hypothetical protein
VSEAHLQAGHITSARELAGQALERAREHHERGYEAWTLRLLGEITLRLDPGSARQFFEDAIRIAGTLQMRPLIARARLGLGRLDRQLGLAGAHEHFAAAAGLFRAMGMIRWLEESERALERLH